MVTALAERGISFDPRQRKATTTLLLVNAELVITMSRYTAAPKQR